jgi:hypothetical protein
MHVFSCTTDLVLCRPLIQRRLFPNGVPPFYVPLKKYREGQGFYALYEAKATLLIYIKRLFSFENLFQIIALDQGHLLLEKVVQRNLTREGDMLSS